MLSRFVLLALFLALYALTVACTGSDDGTPRASPDVDRYPPSDAAAEAHRSSTLPVVITGEARQPTLLGNSLETLVGASDVLIIGRVAGIALPYDPRPGYLGVGFTPDPSLHPDHPKAAYTPSPEELSRPPGRGFTVYTVQVMTALTPSAPGVGSSIYARQSGGVWQGVAYHLAGTPLLEAGGTYLLSLYSIGPIQELGGSEGYSTGPAFMQFIIGSDSRLQPVDPVWGYLPGVAALTGITVDEAAAVIEAAIAEVAAPQP